MDENNTEPLAKRKRVVLSLEDKKNLIEARDQGETVQQLSKKFNIGKSTIPQIMNQRNEIMRRWEILESSVENPDTTRFSGSEESSFDLSMLTFIRQAQSLGEPLTASVLKRRAISIYRQIHGETNFGASESWLVKFKRRYGLHNLVVKEDSSTVMSTSNGNVGNENLKEVNVSKDVTDSEPTSNENVGDEDSIEENVSKDATDSEPEITLDPKKKPISKELVEASKMICEWAKSKSSIISLEKYCMLVELKAQIMSDYIDNNCDN